MSPPDEDSTPDWEELITSARARINAKKARLDEEGRRGPGAEAGFRERYAFLLRELNDLLDELPEVEHQAHGPEGVRIRFAPTDREVRITSLEDQGLVHFVFGHATLGTLHRAEHHAARPFGDGPPNLALLLQQIVDFLIEGSEPRWLTHRPQEASHHVPAEELDQALELPLD